MKPQWSRFEGIAEKSEKSIHSLKSKTLHARRLNERCASLNTRFARVDDVAARVNSQALDILSLTNNGPATRSRETRKRAIQEELRDVEKNIWKPEMATARAETEQYGKTVKVCKKTFANTDALIAIPKKYGLTMNKMATRSDSCKRQLREINDEMTALNKWLDELK